ncbi:MAG: VWA domain-containing protein [archaeon]|nr:VWA domain-containing protein [archaeon]
MAADWSARQLFEGVKEQAQHYPVLSGVGLVMVCVAGVVGIRYGRRKLRERRVMRRYGYIPDQLSDLGQVQAALKRSGLPSSELIVAFDYGERNCVAGARTFRGENLHRIIPDVPNPNPYQFALFMVGKTMGVFDSDGVIPCYGLCADFSILPLGETADIDQLLSLYTGITPKISTVGTPSWKPLIDQAIEHIIETKRFYILIVLTTGACDSFEELREALVIASRFPLSIVAIGLGDGPFSELASIDDEVIPGRLFDNFQFFNLHSILDNAKFPDVDFALATLQEIPFQYAAIRQLGLL